MQIDSETAKALREYIRSVELALETIPDQPIYFLFSCACLGPLPECRCAKRRRLVYEFVGLGELQE